MTVKSRCLVFDLCNENIFIKINHSNLLSNMLPKTIKVIDKLI